jgi:hypothetical protein
VLVAPPAAAAATSDPILVVDSYDVGGEDRPAEVEAGSSFELTIDFENKRARDAQNVLVSLGTAAATQPGAGPSSTSAVPLAVLGTGNQKWVGEIQGESGATVTFSMIADPGATPGVYRLPVTISYESRSIPMSSTHEIGIVILGRVGLEVAELEFPDEMIEGDTAEIYAEVLNAGAAKVSGVTLAVQAEAFDLRQDRVFAGSLDPDESDVIETDGTALRPGTHDVTIVIGYDDSLGRHQETGKTVQIRVTGADEPVEEATPEEADEPQTFGEKVAAFFRGLLGLGG